MSTYRNRNSATGTVTVVTGPPGVDVGPVAARLGRGLRDGLAIRTVVSDGSDVAHASPNPYGSPADSVALSVLPSAWQHPDTNLGIAYTGEPRWLTDDLGRLNRLGHRVTVQHRGDYGAGLIIPAPVEIGDLAAAARDSVLRMGGRVLIEAGDGQTAQDAMHTVGLAPWAAYIGRLDIWVVLDVTTTAPGPEEALERLLVDAGAQVQANGGPRDGSGDGGVSIWIAVLNAHRLPGLGALAGVDTVIGDEPPPLDTAVAVGTLLDRCRRATGTWPALLGTGPSTFIDLLGEHGDTPTD